MSYSVRQSVSITPKASVKKIAKEETSWGILQSQHQLNADKVAAIGREDCCCSCYKQPPLAAILDQQPAVDPQMIHKMLESKELELRAEFKETLERETGYLKERFDFILQNEQVRASLKLREAHRERKEKIRILTQQLQCKNIASLLYVICAERARSKFEKLQIIEKYTNYINGLNDILEEGQELILNLSRGYKTAARVDHEWQTKMKKVIAANFVYHFAGGRPEQNQYFFDVPSLLHTDSPKEDNPEEDPIEEEYEPSIDSADLPENKTWWERLDDEDRPFAVFGDMADMKPPVRRETLKKIKAPKTAPKKWKEYTFRDMFLLADCPKADEYKDEFLARDYEASRNWECPSITEMEKQPLDFQKRHVSLDQPDPAVLSEDRRNTEMRANIGSIMKIMTASGMIKQDQNAAGKANLLGARDSMEIVSSTKLRDSNRPSKTPNANKKIEPIQVGSRRTSLYFEDEVKPDELSELLPPTHLEEKSILKSDKDSPPEREGSILTKPSVHEDHYEPSIYQSTTERDGEIIRAQSFAKTEDSLTKIQVRAPEKDSYTDKKINYEKVCPMERCQRSSMLQLLRSLPAYMREHTFTHREQTFDKYETCTPEQLEILRTRLEESKKKDRRRLSLEPEDPLLDWQASVEGVACQTSLTDLLDLPPCTCKESTIDSGPGAAYKLEDLIPVKQRLERVQRDCFFDPHIDFNRFKVLGQDSSDSVRVKNELNNFKEDFTRSRLQEIRKILKQHPSLCEIFQANTHS